MVLQRSVKKQIEAHSEPSRREATVITLNCEGHFTHHCFQEFSMYLNLSSVHVTNTYVPYLYSCTGAMPGLGFLVSVHCVYVTEAKQSICLYLTYKLVLNAAHGGYKPKKNSCVYIQLSKNKMCTASTFYHYCKNHECPNTVISIRSAPPSYSRCGRI